MDRIVKFIYCVTLSGIAKENYDYIKTWGPNTIFIYKNRDDICANKDEVLKYVKGGD